MEKLKELSKKMVQDAVAWRRHFHQFPELSNQEYRTSEKIREILDKFGIKYKKAAGTGVIAEIQGAGKDIIGLRADMDALPVKEEPSLEFASENDGVMHACGHDAHMAIALGVAGVFSKIKPLPFSIRFIFQPSEESLPCGAPRMIKEGALNGMKCLIGFHVWAGLETGTFSVISGPVMASADRFKILIKGKGGHGASPHTAIDPIVASAYFISQLQSIVSRKSAPVEPLVISVGKISAGDAFNVIPEQAELVGTVRTLNSKQNALAQKWIKKLLKGLEQGTGVKTALEYEGFVPVTINDRALSEKVVDILLNNFGKAAVKTDEKPTMGSEDFSFYSQIIPCCYFNIGCGRSEFFHHSSRFNLDEKCIGYGIQSLSNILWEIGSQK
ncbi:MAG: amidohydrolase [Candidatus Omnitrophica bacterium]|nr:amidohydrolase [Candidatus Omnitrophota bacterium]MCM8828392.1 amidohydrolase [Candidatus Omnitrophota bacterium]